jgi:hypothetical protein
VEPETKEQGQEVEEYKSDLDSRPEEGKRRPLPQRKAGSDVDSTGRAPPRCTGRRSMRNTRRCTRVSSKNARRGSCRSAMEAGGSVESRNAMILHIFDHRIEVCTGRTPTGTSTELSDDVLLRSIYAQKGSCLQVAICNTKVFTISTKDQYKGTIHD